MNSLFMKDNTQGKFRYTFLIYPKKVSFFTSKGVIYKLSK